MRQCEEGAQRERNEAAGRETYRENDGNQTGDWNGKGTAWATRTHDGELGKRMHGGGVGGRVRAAERGGAGSGEVEGGARRGKWRPDA